MAPLVLWTRIKQAVSTHSDIPRSFWTTAAMRRDIVKVVCYESSFNYRAANGPQYGWFQMSHTNIQSEGVTWTQYWDGDSHGGAGWYQCTAGERYILHRYGSPAGAWAHEANYGWY